ncbi:MAG: hypothetical protein A3C06_02895 [Candidatus Taylorbacteria bacterium RIFCSPHIGHO2_02_FULL_46_13]|uniref:Sugar 3,4-ketoisomerase QdtA cupin domain-containing protein n=1 Tax=Candidatus Taylorbacteria bacterium RIFCSPHIGHO2_02_FULL_46_13 TaxID=1802312 RepID=A0A1G2MTE1_9BACT|nr:MAG: hypothetical protein A3C06_02895 [Candidatus Taylorbacteria bacterium RIFCSPHIGHO2_02_FULL_46_13]
MKKLYTIIKFPSFETKNGALTMFQEGKNAGEVPFTIKRTLVTKCTESSEPRGAHTHHQSRQVFMVLSGGCDVELDNGAEKTTVTLSHPEEGLVLEPYVWHVMKNFKKDTVTLALFDSLYDEKDYIRNYEEFKKCLKK